MRLNAKRGLFRLWLVIAILWVIGAGAWLRPDQTVMHLWQGPSQDELAVWPFVCDFSAPDERCRLLIEQSRVLVSTKIAELAEGKIAEYRKLIEGLEAH